MDHMDIMSNWEKIEKVTRPKRASFAEGGSKGVVAEQILSSMVEKGKGADFVLCIGDDRSDEDMLEGIASIKTREPVAANTSVFACTVGQKQSKARYYLDGTNEVINMLGALANMADPSSPTPEPSSSTSEVEAEVSKSVSFASPL